MTKGRNKNIRRLKKILRGFFYVYGIVGFPLSYLVELHRHSTHPFLRAKFKSKIRLSCENVTFLISFILCMWFPVEVQKSFPTLEQYGKWIVAFVCIFVFSFDFLIVPKFFRWLFNDKSSDEAISPSDFKNYFPKDKY